MFVDPIYDVLNDIFDILNNNIYDAIDPQEFEKLLSEYGFMIVPIEDPTNLRYGEDD